MSALSSRILPALLALSWAGGSRDQSRPASRESEDPQEGGAVQARKEKHPLNHLKGQTSPYLLQHARNPVDWYPWGPEALGRAKKENKPIFLSIGYSACHWCHVMERESFENEEIAKLLNRSFVCIKVDREERPDLDEIYMSAVQAFTGGHGGWPMSVFLTPEGRPFWGGTYFPPKDRGGLPGFDRIVGEMARIWREERDKVEKRASEVVAYLKDQAAETASGTALQVEALLGRAVENSIQRFDPVYGGFASPPGYAPKFPHCTELTFLLRYGKRKGLRKPVELVEKTLEEMARGGIYDQVGGGFARYSVDRHWTVPHFEKMLYDNSQLASLYLEAWQATGKAFYREVAVEILDYVVREMTSPEGGFYSTTDADSEGEEGKFFLWTRKEFEDLLGEEAPIALRFFGVTEEGNFEGRNILTNRLGLEALSKEFGKPRKDLGALLDRARDRLYQARRKRVPPGLDDKILSAWNGLMLSAFAKGALLLERRGWLETARRNAGFLLEKMVDERGRLFRTRRKGRSHLGGYLEDHAFVIQGLIDLFEADPDPRWIQAALRLQGMVDAHFSDPERGAWFSTADDHEKLLLRSTRASESSLPSDIGVAAMNAARLGLLKGDPALLARARKCLQRFAGFLARFPNASCQLLVLHDFLASDPAEIYIAGSGGDSVVKAMLAKVRRRYPPYRVVAFLEKGREKELVRILPAAEGKLPLEGRATAYVCHEGVCKKPITDPRDL